MYHIGWGKVQKSQDNKKVWEKAIKTAKATGTQGKRQQQLPEEEKRNSIMPWEDNKYQKRLSA